MKSGIDRWLAALASMVFATAALAASSEAQEGIPGADVISIHLWLRAHSPELRARELEAQAADERIQPAGALPDPMLRLELNGIDRNEPRLLPGQVGDTLYEVRQRFPLWGKRALAREIARDDAVASRLTISASRLSLVGRAESAYVRYWSVDGAIAVVDRVIALAEDLRRIAETRYAAGVAPQQDAIKAQVEVVAMRRDRIERQTMAHEAAAQLNTLLGRTADAPLAAPKAAPDLRVSVGTLDALLTSVAGHHPAVAVQAQRVAAAERRADLVRRERYPDLEVGLGLMQVDNRLDSWELMFEVEIPLQQGARRHRERAAALERDAASAMQESIATELRGEAGESWARWQGARERRRLISDSLLPQSEANFQSALASYQVGAVDFGTLLEALRQWRQADLERVDALRDELVAAAQVRALEEVTP